MNFLTPLAFTLAITIPIVIAMYLLKLRRTEQVVSSTYLWQRMVRDVEANAPWQRLRRNLLLFLQLLVLLLLIFALVRPFTWTQGGTGQAVILIFDTSASMAATDVQPNRLETAKEQARLLISNLPEDARATLIAAGENTQVVVSSSQDKRLLYQRLDELQIQPGGSNLTSALELSSAIATRQPNAEIVIYSDGNVSLPDRLSTQGKLRFLPIGASGNNQAISLLTLDPAVDGASLTAFIQVINYHSEPVNRRLTLTADGLLVDVHDLEIPAQGQVAVFSEGLPLEIKVLEAALTESDALALDDQAWAIHQISGSQKVSLVSQGNRFIETALGLFPNLELNIQPPGSHLIPSGTETATDLIIFDSHTPTETLPTGNLFFIGPLSSSSNFTITGTIENPVPKPSRTEDTLLRHIDLSSIHILDSARIPLPDWARPVIVDESTGAPLLFVGEIQGQRIAVLAFDPRHSDLPLQVAFPILMANLMDWLLPGRIGEIPTQLKPGEVVAFTPPADINSLRVTHPDGASTRLITQDGRAIFANTNQPGIYQVDWGEGQSLSFAVNFSDSQESDILPNENPPLLSALANNQEGVPEQARREWWRIFAAAALCVLIIEWLVYNRATITKVWHKLRVTPRSETEQKQL